MLRRLALVVGCVLAVSGSALAQSSSTSSQNGSAPRTDFPATVVTGAKPAGGNAVFRSGVEVVGLNVTVTDEKDRYVLGLKPSDFEVLEDGVKQELSFFADSKLPVDLAILLDTSASMRDKLAEVERAATGFVGSLRPGDRASVVLFNDRVEELQPLTDDRHALETAIRRSKASGNTVLHTAVYVALKEYAPAAKENATIRRYAIVLLSDGEDTASLVSFDDVLDLARRSGIAIYTIKIVSAAQSELIKSESTPRFFSEADYEMKALAQETGGRAFFPLQIAELNGVYGEISTELSNQYSLGYASKNTMQDGSFRRVLVRILEHGLVHPRTRSGYYAPGGAQVTQSRRQP